MNWFLINRQNRQKYRFWLIFLGVNCLLWLTNCQNQLQDITNFPNATGETIVVLGDSITAGYGLSTQQAYPYLLSQKLDIPIINRGVSGNTTADGLERVSEDVLAEQPWLVIIGLGGNDFLKKVPKSETEANLRAIITQVQSEKAVTVLLGMNLGLFTDEYKDLYDAIAKDTGSLLIPQILKGVIDNPRHRQQDIIHPNAIGQEIIADRIAKAVKPIIEQAKPTPVVKKVS